MAKKIYSGTVKKWLVAAGITSGTLVGGIFLYLAMIGAITVNGYSGDSACDGTLDDPCYAYINFTANEDIFIYPIDYDPWGRNTPFEFDKNLKEWQLQRSWGDGWRNLPLDRSCTGTWCGLSDAKDERVFSVAFRKGKDYQIRIVAYKDHPTDKIKWSAFDGKIDPWWDSNWNNCVNVTVTNHGSTALTDYPIFLNVTYLTGMQADFDDVRILNGSCNGADQVELFMELENKTDSDYAVIWIDANLTAGTNAFSIYYNNSGASSNWDSSGNVWNSNFVNVMLMNNNLDSTGTKDGSAEGSPVQVDGLAGGAYEFNGYDRFALEGTAITSDASDMTLCGFFKPYEDSITSHYSIYTGKTGSGSDNTVIISFLNDGKIDMWADNGYAFWNDHAYTANEWVMVCNVQDSAVTSKSYYDGELDNTDSSVTDTWSIVNYYIGGVTNYFNGTIDNMFIANKAMSVDEINMTYNNLMNYVNTISFDNPESQPSTETPILYVNVTATGACSDSYTRDQAMSQSTPWCTLDAPLTNDKALAGDKVIVACGIYNGESDISSFDQTNDLNITCETQGCCVLTRIDTDFNNTANAQWSYLSTSDFYSASVSQSDSLAIPRVYYTNNSPFFAYDDYTMFLATDYPEASQWNGTTNVLSIKILSNPNDTSLYVADDFRPIKLLGNIASGGSIVFTGFNFSYVGQYGMFIDTTSNVIVENCSFHGGLYGIYVNNHDSAYDDITVRNNYFDMKMQDYWTGYDLKTPQVGTMESGAIHVINMPGSMFIHDNLIENSHGGIELIADGSEELDGTLVYNNVLLDGRGSQIEIEDYCYNSWYYNNTIYNGTFGASFASANSDAGMCYFVNNTIYLKNHDYWAVGNYPIAYGVKGQYLSGVSATNWTIQHNTIVAGRGTYCITEPCWTDSNFTDNIIIGIVDCAIKGSGLSSSGMNYDYNAYYHNTSYDYLLENYNSTSTDYSDLASAQAALSWDDNSVEEDVVFASTTYGNEDFLVPIAGSSVCSAASDGGDIGSKTCLTGTDSDYAGIGDDATTLFVDQKNPSCSDSYARSQALSGFTPWCDLATAMDKVLSGDTVYVLNGSYNGRYNYYSKTLTGQVEFTNYPNNEVHLTNFFDNYNETDNELWNNRSNSSYNMYNTTLSDSYSSTISAQYENGTQIFAFSGSSSFDDFIDSSIPSAVWYNSSNNDFWVRFNDGSDPNEMQLYLSSLWEFIIDIRHISGGSVKVQNFNLDYGRQSIYVYNSSNVTLYNMTIADAGKYGIQVGNSGNEDNINISNNDISMNMGSNWTWNDMKTYTSQDSSGILLTDVGDGTKIHNNTIHGYMNGLFSTNGVFGNNTNISIYSNTLYEIYDDALELDYKADGIIVYKNLIYDVFNSISLQPGNGLYGSTNWIYTNIMTSNKTINVDGSTYTKGRCFKIADQYVKNYNITDNTCFGNGRECSSGTNNCVINTSFVNNLFAGDAPSYIIRKTGIASNGSFQDYNIYYNATTGDLFSYWNNDSVSTAYSTLNDALDSTYDPGTWDSHSHNENPEVYPNGTLYDTSIAINNGYSTGVTEDFYGNSIIGNKDIGATEDQSPLDLAFNDLRGNLRVELSSNLNATATYVGDTVCIDFDHPNYGINVSCAVDETSYNLNVTYFRNNLLNTTNSSENITFTQDTDENITIGITGHQHDEIENLTLNLTVFPYNGVYPSDVKIYVNNTLSNDISEFGATEINYFNGTSQTNIQHYHPTNKVVIAGYIRIPEDVDVVTHGDFTIQAYTGMVYQEDADVFTVSTSSSTYAYAYAKYYLDGNPLWQAKYSGDTGGTYNYSYTTLLGAGCLYSDDEVNFILESGMNGVACWVKVYCKTSSVWHLLHDSTDSSCNYDPPGAGYSNQMNDSDWSTGGVWDAYTSPGMHWESAFNPRKNRIDEEAVYWNYTYPTEGWIEVGYINGTRDWNYTGTFVGPNVTLDFSNSINDYIANETPNDDGYWYVPINLYLNNATILNFTLANMTWTYDPNPVIIDSSLVSDFLTNNTEFADVPIKIHSATNGTIQINDVKYDYAGGNKTYNALSHTDDYSINKSFNLTYYYSKWDYSLPTGINYLEIIPKNSTSQNVTPLGQNSSIPILNFTFYNYGGGIDNFSVWINESSECVDLSMGRTSNRLADTTINFNAYVVEDGSTYVCAGDWGATYVCTNTYDGDWATYGVPEVGADNTYLYVNYTKPLTFNIDSAIWKVKDDKGTGLLTIPDECVSALTYTMNLAINLRAPGSESRYYCYNASDWIYMGHRFSGSSIKLYEESINFGANESGKWNELQTNIDYSDSLGNWWWADYDCTYTGWRVWYPEVYYRACCEDCDVCSSELI